MTRVGLEERLRAGTTSRSRPLGRLVDAPRSSSPRPLRSTAVRVRAGGCPQLNREVPDQAARSHPRRADGPDPFSAFARCPSSPLRCDTVLVVVGDVRDGAHWRSWRWCSSVRLGEGQAAFGGPVVRGLRRLRRVDMVSVGWRSRADAPISARIRRSARGADARRPLRPLAARVLGLSAFAPGHLLRARTVTP